MSKKNRYHWILLVMLALLGNAVFSQSQAPYKIQTHLYSGNGLLQNSIYSIVQDSSGYTWLNNGLKLTRLDFPFKENNSFLLPGNLQNDNFGKLGITSEGVFFFIDDSKKKVFSLSSPDAKTVKPVFENKMILYNGNFSATIVADSSDIIKLFQKVPVSADEMSLESCLKQNPGLLNNGTFVLSATQFYILFNNRVSFFDIKAAQTTSFKLPETGKPSYGLIAGGKFIVTNLDNLFYTFSKDGQRAIDESVFMQELKALAVNNAGSSVSFFSDAVQNYVVAGNKLYRSKNADRPFELIANIPDKAAVSAVVYDPRQDVYLIGTTNLGLLVAYPVNFQLYSYPVTSDVNNIIYSHMRLDNDEIITHFGRIKKEEHGYKIKLTPPYVQKHYLHTNAGDIVTGVDKTVKFWNKDFTAENETLFTKNPITRLADAGNDSIFFSTFQTVGLIENRKLQYEKDIGKRFGRILQIEYATDDFCWLVTDSGMVRYRTALKTCDSIPLMKSVILRAVFTDKKGTTWISTGNGGIFRYDDKRGLVQLPLDIKKSLMNAHAFVEDRKGFFWISTNTGIIQVLKSDLENYDAVKKQWIYYYRYSEASGLPVNELNGGNREAYTLSKNGDITFAAITGVLEFNPEKVSNLLPGRLSVRKISDEDTVFQSQDITLNYNFRNITFEFACPYFGSVENLQIYYKLEGLDNDWSLIQDDMRFTLNRLPYGNYKLVVRKVNGFGDNNFQQLEISITVLPPWYLSAGAIVSWLILGIAALWFFIKWRIRVIRKKAFSEKLVVESELKALRAQINPHFLQNTFNLMAQGIATGNTDHAIEIIRKVAVYMRQILNKSEKTAVSLEDEIEYTEDYLKMQQIVHPGLFTYSIKLDDNVDTYGVQVPTMLIQPIVENCIKHGFKYKTAGGEIIISIKQLVRSIKIVIRDNGAGIPDGDNTENAKGIALTRKRVELMFKEKQKKNVQVTLANSDDFLPGTIFTIIFPTS